MNKEDERLSDTYVTPTWHLSDTYLTREGGQTRFQPTQTQAAEGGTYLTSI